MASRSLESQPDPCTFSAIYYASSCPAHSFDNATTGADVGHYWHIILATSLTVVMLRTRLLMAVTINEALWCSPEFTRWKKITEMVDTGGFITGLLKIVNIHDHSADDVSSYLNLSAISQTMWSWLLLRFWSIADFLSFFLQGSYKAAIYLLPLCISWLPYMHQFL